MRFNLGSSCMRRVVLLVVCAGLLTIHGSLIAAAKEEVSALEREMEESKAEDEADRARGEGFVSEKTFSGRLVLGQVVAEREDIVGIFTIEGGKAYPIKLVSADLLDEVKPYDRKTVSLQGKFRNQGKYFVVTGVIHPPAPVQPFNKAGGL